MDALIIKENVCTKRLENLTFFNAAKEKDLVDSHVPRAQRAHDSFMGGCVSCRYQRGSDRYGILRELLLYDGNGFQKLCEGSLGERLFL